MIDAILILLSCTGTFVAGYFYAMSKTRREIREIRQQTVCLLQQSEGIIQRIATAQETIRSLQEQRKTQTDAPLLQEDSSKQSK